MILATGSEIYIKPLGESLTKIGCVISMSDISEEINIIEPRPCLDDEYQDELMGIRKRQQVTLTMKYADDVDLYIDRLRNREQMDFVIGVGKGGEPSGAGWQDRYWIEFSGRLTGFSLSPIQAGEFMQSTFKINLTDDARHNPVRKITWVDNQTFVDGIYWR